MRLPYVHKSGRKTPINQSLITNIHMRTERTNMDTKYRNSAQTYPNRYPSYTQKENTKTFIPILLLVYSVCYAYKKIHIDSYTYTYCDTQRERFMCIFAGILAFPQSYGRH